MKTTLRTTEHYNVGPYEWIEVGAEVEGEIDGPQDLMDLNDGLDAVLATARERVKSLSRNNESMIFDHPAVFGES